MDALTFVETRFGLNKKFHNKKVMVNCIDYLKKKDFYYKDSEMKSVYENKLLIFLKACKKKSGDRWQVLDSLMEYIWHEFDSTEFHSYTSFKKFLKWSAALIRHTYRRTVKPLKTIKGRKYFCL